MASTASTSLPHVSDQHHVNVVKAALTVAELAGRSLGACLAADETTASTLAIDGRRAATTTIITAVITTIVTTVISTIITTVIASIITTTAATDGHIHIVKALGDNIGPTITSCLA